jgi:hypothetical protein
MVEGSGATLSKSSLPEIVIVEFQPAIVPLDIVPNVPVIDWA